MKGAGIDPGKLSAIVVTHFHPITSTAC